MVQEKNFNKMCSEVLEILKCYPKEDIEKIPDKIINKLNENKDANHKVIIDPNKSIFDQPVLEETIIMMFLILRNYWSTPEEKKEIDDILKENEIRFENYYSYKEIFNQENAAKINETKLNNESSKTESNSLIVREEDNFIKKVIKLIKDFFKKKNKK